MPQKRLNLSGGLNTRDDENAVGFDGFTALKNTRHEGMGSIKKRFGTTKVSGANYDSKSLTQLQYFVHEKLYSTKITASSNNITFSDTSNTIAFASDPGLYAHFKVGDVILMESTNSTFLKNNYRPGTIKSISNTSGSPGWTIEFEESYVVIVGGTQSGDHLTIGYGYMDGTATYDTELITSDQDRTFGLSGTGNWAEYRPDGDDITLSKYSSGGVEALEVEIGSGNTGYRYGATLADEFIDGAGGAYPVVKGGWYAIEFAVTSQGSAGTAHQKFISFYGHTFNLGRVQSLVPTEYTDVGATYKVFCPALDDTSGLTVYVKGTSSNDTLYDNFSVKRIKAPMLFPYTSATQKYEGEAWVGVYEVSDNKLVSLATGSIDTDEATFGDQVVIKDYGDNSSDYPVDASVHNKAVRFSGGHEAEPSIFTYVNRAHFNNIFETHPNGYYFGASAGWKFDDSRAGKSPVTVASTSVISPLDDSTLRDARSIGSLNFLDNIYYYKIIPVYDGNEEATLGDNITGGNYDFTSSEVPPNPNNPNKNIAMFTADFTLNTLNPRISSFNVYRSTDTTTWNKIATINAGGEDSNAFKLTDGYVTNGKVYLSGFGVTISDNPAYEYYTAEGITPDTLHAQLDFLTGQRIIVDGITLGCEYNTAVSNTDAWDVCTLDDDGGASGGVNSAMEESTNLSVGSDWIDQYGHSKMYKFNEPIQDTGMVTCLNDDGSGGSLTGGVCILTTYHTCANGDLGSKETLNKMDCSALGNLDFAKHGGSGGSDAETNVTDWSVYGEAGIYDGSYDETINPSQHLKFVGDGSELTFKCGIGTGTTGSDVMYDQTVEGSGDFDTDQASSYSGQEGIPAVIGFWVKAKNFDADTTWEIWVDSADSHVAGGGTTLVQLASGVGNLNKWRYVQREFTPTHATGNRLMVHVQSGKKGEILLDKVFCGQLQNPTLGEHTVYHLDGSRKVTLGTSIYQSTLFNNENFGDSEFRGGLWSSSLTSHSGLIKDNNLDLIGLTSGANITAEASSQTLYLNKTYSWRMTGSSNYLLHNNDELDPAQSGCETVTGTSTEASQYDEIRLRFVDKGLTLGATHYLGGITSLQTNYKYSEELNGRLFTGNVKITSDEGESEYRDNFIIFSELARYSVLPISNYIQLSDLQGGQLIGLRSIMSNLVAFMERGIFILNVPSASPGTWSLSESHPNATPLDDKAIVKTTDGVWYMGRDNVYLLDNSLNLIPKGEQILNTYKSYVTDIADKGKSRLFYDAQNQRIFMRMPYFPNGTSTSLFIYEMKKQIWHEHVLDTQANLATYFENMSADNKGNNYYIGKRGAHGDVWATEDASSSESLAMTITTGYQQLTDLDRQGIIRKIMATGTKISDGSGDGLDITVTSKTDSGATSLIKTLENMVLSNTAEVTESRRVGHRGKYVKVSIVSASDADENQEINVVDVDYDV